MNPSSRQAPPDPLCCVRLRVSQDTRSVRLNVNLHDVLNLSSISIDVLHLLSILNRCSPPLVNSQSRFSTCRLRSLRAADSSPLSDPERQPRTSSSYAAARSLQAVVHFPLGHVFGPHVSGVFDSRHFHGGQGTACHCLLHPQDLRMAMSHSSYSASWGDRFRRCGTHSYTWLYHFCHVSSHGHCAQTSRCTLGQRVELRFA